MSDPQLTSLQLQSAYRFAVRSSLVTFYRKSDSEAELLVDGWWSRLSPLADIQSEMFLHEEALATAADLAHTTEVLLTDDVRERYKKILRDSTEAALLEKKPGRNVQEEVLKQRLG